MSTPLSLTLALVVGPLAAPGARSGAASDVPYDIVLPEGPAARAWAGVGPDTLPAAIDPRDVAGDPDDPRLADGATWLAWAEDLAAERDAASADAARRARLALFAWAGRRSDDAWAHVARTTGDPRWTAAVTARLLPGVPLEHLAEGGLEPGGRPRALPEDVVLRPALPPPVGPAAPGRLQRRRARVDGLVVGATTLSMIVRVEAEGVQIDFVHVAGPAARLLVVPPVPDGFATRVEYVDWFRQDTVGEPLAVVVDPKQQEPNTVYARMRATELRWPTRLPRALPAALGLDGLHLVAPREPSGGRERVDGLARALGRLYEFDVAVHARPAPARGGLWVDLGSGADGKFRSVVSLVERSVLAR